jgi:hypothetical protein
MPRESATATHCASALIRLAASNRDHPANPCHHRQKRAAFRGEWLRRWDAGDEVHAMASTNVPFSACTASAIDC